MHRLSRAQNIFVEKCLNLTHRQVSSFRFNDLHCVRFKSRFPILRKILLDILYQDLRESGKSSEGGRKKQPSGRRRVDPSAVSRSSDGMRRGSGDKEELPCTSSGTREYLRWYSGHTPCMSAIVATDTCDRGCIRFGHTRGMSLQDSRNILQYTDNTHRRDIPRVCP